MLLTKRESQILKLHSFGLTPDEIGNKLFISRETVRKTISNIKEKLHLQKATEISGYYWCSVFGMDFIEQRRQLLAFCLLVIIALPNAFDEDKYILRRSLRTRHRQEQLFNTTTQQTY